MKTNEMMCELIDPVTKSQRKAIIKALGDGQIGIHIDGFPILIDLNDNKLQVFIWSDINNEDPTHTVDMTGARVDKRVENHKELRKQGKNVHCFTLRDQLKKYDSFGVENGGICNCYFTEVRD